MEAGQSIQMCSWDAWDVHRHRIRHIHDTREREGFMCLLKVDGAKSLLVDNSGQIRPVVQQHQEPCGTRCRRKQRASRLCLRKRRGTASQGEKCTWDHA